MRAAALFLAIAAALTAQEADSGFDLRTNISGLAAYTHQLSAAPRSDSPETGGVRLILYPMWKIDQHWSFSGAVQIASRPYFYEQFSTQGYGVRANILQGYLAYSRIAANRSLVVRVGQMTSAFGSFLLRYDDAVNPLIDVPLSYGYYGRGVTSDGLMGAQVDATLSRLDVRAQFTNSSAANRRSIFDRDQYGAWTGGAGLTLRQGLRIGVSSYRGAYLHRQFAFYFPGEAKPKDLPGSAYGIDTQWATGHWNLSGELQRFQLTYRAIPDFNEHTGYAEVRRVLSPRWFAAVRAGYLRANVIPAHEVYETALGFRPNRHQLIKFGYELQRGRFVRSSLAGVYAFQLVTTLPSFSISR